MIQKIRNIFSALSKKQLFLLGGCLIVLALIIRACTGPLLPGQKVYHIVRSNNWSPLTFYGKEYNMGAFVDELIRGIGSIEHLNIYLVSTPNLDPRGLFALLDSEHYDAIVVTFSPITVIQNKYIYSNPIYNAGPVLIVPESSKATSLKDLQGKPIGIQNRSTQAFDIGKDSSMFISYDNMVTALDDLEGNIISGVIMEAELANIYTHGNYKGKLKVATAPLTDLGLRLVTKNSVDGKYLIEKFNEGLAKTEKEGIFENGIKKWDLANP